MLPPSPSDPGEPAAPPAPPCAVHPDRPSHAACARCGKGACTPCTIVLATGESICAACDDAETLPWERRRTLGVGRALALTIRGVLLHPSRFFRMRTRERALWPTLALGLALHLVGQTGQAITDLAFLARTRAELAEDPVGRMLLPYVTAEVPLIHLAASPVLFFVQLYVAAGLWWLGLRAVGGLRRPLHVIVRTLCHVQAFSLLVPIVAPVSQLGIVGGAVAVVFVGWAIGVQVLAISRAQGIEPGRGLLALLVWASIAGCAACLIGSALAWAVATQIRLPG